VIWWQKESFFDLTREWKIFLVTGTLQFFFNYGLLFWGEQHISSGLAAVLQATIPAFGLFLARIYVGEAITRIKIAALLLGIIGVGIIFYDQLSFRGTLALLGCLAVVVGAFGAAYASVLTKARLQGFNPASVVFGQMLVGQIPLWTVGLVLEGNPFKLTWTWLGVVCVIYLAIVGSVLAFWLYYWLLARMDVSKAMMIAFVTPLVAVIIGSFFGEALERKTMLGGAFILASVGLIVVRAGRPGQRARGAGDEPHVTAG
jgi:drug/metabolite transporter (DMT)-like permease